MEYTIENAYLQVTVQSLGAEITSVIRKSDGVEHMWQADPALWGQHAPILFPHTGRLKDGVLSVDGDLREGAIHGFARNLEHTLVYRNRDTLVLQLTETRETLAYWPRKFRLLSVFSLEEDTLVHTLTVENRDDRAMQFGIGFHPGFIPNTGGNVAFVPHAVFDSICQVVFVDGEGCLAAGIDGSILH